MINPREFYFRLVEKTGAGHGLAAKYRLRRRFLLYKFHWPSPLELIIWRSISASVALRRNFTLAITTLQRSDRSSSYIHEREFIATMVRTEAVRGETCPFERKLRG
jgi:hypothetical protein